MQAEPFVSVVEGARITEVGQEDGRVWARSESGEEWTADLLVGADGYRSVVRAHVAPEQPDADYAGYVVWLGQSEIPEAWRRRVRGIDFMSGESNLLAVYPLIEPDGDFHRYGWGWFDPSHNRLLHEIGAVRDGKVQHTPRAADIPDAVYQSLERQAGKWGEPWRTGLVEAICQREIIATPISEYVPERVVRGHVALVGDAAHAQSPMTGARFEEAVQDALALASTLRAQPDPTMALPLHEHARLFIMDFSEPLVARPALRVRSSRLRTAAL